MLPISLVVLTHNEARNVAGCLDSAAGFSDRHVLDSGSADDTCEIATRHGATVHHNPFTGFGDQRNWAIDRIDTRHDWQLHLDADERLTPEAIAEMAAAVSRDGGLGGFYVPSKLMFAGRWLRYAGGYPTYQVRLFHKGRLRFCNHGHGQREVTNAPLGRLREPYLHFAFSHGLDRWFAKHAIYARREAEQAVGEAGGSGWSGLVSADPVRRRRALKHLAYRLPCRYLLRLAYMLVVQRAIFDGPAGVTYAHMMATYEAMMETHLRLLRRGTQP